MNEQVGWLEANDIIREVHCPIWFENVVVVKKNNGKKKVFIDFTDLNKTYPEDSFPLPMFDKLVDATI